ncbi:hypothetical protein [Hwanghaeella sp.]|uniref:hypothetical protein n=1 Tax=Hwanghaeella sp. TaxID=2605943 RepID=UPI003CCBC812
MNEAVRDCLVEGYEELIPSLELPDENDRHVLAAAIMGKADAIVTFNLKDFPDNTLAAYGVQAIHPDDFLINQIDIDQTTVLGALRQTRQNLSKSNLSADELIDKLEHGGLPQSAARLRPLKILI